MDVMAIKECVANLGKEEKQEEWMIKKQEIVDALQGIVTRRMLSRMTLQDALQFLTLILENPKVQELSAAGKYITIEEVTRSARGPRKKKADKTADTATPEEDGEGDDGEEDTEAA